MMSQKPTVMYLVLLFGLVFILASGKSQAADKFYVIAHMVNDAQTAGWAISKGANAIEMDLNFNQRNGNPLAFHHGTPCDCTCLLFGSFGNSVCQFRQACTVWTPYKKQLQYVRQFRNLALIYIDSKITKKFSSTVQVQAGKKVVKALENELFKKGYGGKVLIGSANQGTYLRAAAVAARSSRWKNRIYFTLDQLGKHAGSAIQFLARLPSKNIIYSTGVTICSPTSYYDAIVLAKLNKDRGVLSNVFIWTLDSSKSFYKYIDAGARGILTNRVSKLVGVVRSRHLQLATPLDNSLPPRISNKVIKSVVCDCNYSPGGCRISRASPSGTACKCIYRGYWTCRGRVVRCRNSRNGNCVHPSRSIHACIQGGGDCGGYKNVKCDCDYKDKYGSWHIRKASGCKISTKAIPLTACKCSYKGGWTCGGSIVRCRNPNSYYCKKPGYGKNSCRLGGGDCDGY